MSRKKPLGNGVTLRAVNVRSASLERDLDTAELDRLSLTGRGNDVLRRLEDALRRPQRTRAWSITGPYGSGKSSFALLVANLVSTDAGRRTAALARVRETDAPLATAIFETLAEHAPNGMLRAVTGARREPVSRTIVRALHAAMADAQTLRATSALTKARRALEGIDRELPSHATTEAILEAVRALTAVAPVLLVVDEFGKTLEYQASAGADLDGDLFLLQELSELSASDRGVPLFLMTLQHLGYLDYAGATDSLQRREWSKIQGRFEDILFVEDATESARLLARTIQQPTPAPTPLARYGTVAANAWEDAGLGRVLSADADLFRTVYPLHPLVTVVAPMLFASLAQNDRTLTGFLAGDEPHTLSQYLEDKPSGESGDPTSFPTMKLPTLYDYLASGARTSLLASSSAARWLEIETRVSEARALATADLEVLKTVAILNLVDAGGALRASADNIAFALLEPTDWDDKNQRQKTADRLKRPTIKGFLNYRAFSDEWRLWQGSDVDLVARVERARAALADAPSADLIPRTMLPQAVVAGRHAQYVGMLRYFEVDVTDGTSKLIAAPRNRSAEDGLLVFHLGSARDVPAVTGDKPVVIGTTPDAKLVIDAALEAKACQLVLDGGGLDVPAAAELRERIAQTRATLASTLSEAFRPERPDVHWQFGQDRLEGQRSLSALVSVACDRAYDKTPRIRNEMLGRHTLTSQGAKARKILIGLSLTESAKPRLSMAHYGPERAMYEGVLHFLGLHGENRDGTAGFRAPKRDSSVYATWGALTGALLGAAEPVTVDELYTLLMAPPYGVKSGVVPVLLVAALELHRDELAFFDDGTYQPRLEAVHFERLVKTPDRFSIIASGATNGPRAELLAALANALKVPAPTGQSPRLLRVVNALLSRVRELDPYAQRTTTVSDTATAIRAAVMTARDPGYLVFTALPVAIGEKAFPAGPKAKASDPAIVVEAVMDALEELALVRVKLDKVIVKTLCDAFGTRNGLAALRTSLVQRSEAVKGQQLEPGLAGLVKHAVGELPNEDWLEPFVMLVCGRSLTSWTDQDLAQLATKARQLNAGLEGARTLHGRGTNARLLSLTDADGSDLSILLDRAPDRALQPVLRDALKRARAIHGAGAATELLHLLLEQVLNDIRTIK